MFHFLLRNLAVNKRNCVRKRVVLFSSVAHLTCKHACNLVKDKTKSKSVQRQNLFLIDDAKAPLILHRMEAGIQREAHCNVSLIDLSIYKIAFAT